MKTKGIFFCNNVCIATVPYRRWLDRSHWRNVFPGHKRWKCCLRGRTRV